ncbi:MAG: hypothetical protein EOO93_00430 [Pedobacter sp.]|nr:MAG: hypothetical protein EOO93_00430 [Pedobacter sp.]
MPSLAKQFTKEQIESALEYIIENNIPLTPSTVHDLAYKGLKFPPKDVVRWAAKLAKLKDIDSYSLSGGANTNEPLKKLGFTIVEKNADFFGSLIEEYKNHLLKNGLSNEIYKWHLVEEFKGRPSMNASNFTEEIKTINFANLVYGVGIGAIRHLAKALPNEYKKCFNILFDETLSIATRVSEFNSHVTTIYRTLVPELNRSAHHDERTTATFLTYHNPDKYTFYKDSFYQILCKRLGIKPKGKGEKYEHYLQIVEEFITDYISVDKVLIQLVNNQKLEDCYVDSNYKILAQDILYTILEKQNMTFANLVEEITTILSDDAASNVRIITKKIESIKGSEWIKLGDQHNVIRGSVAHYEISLDKKSQVITVSLHFEEKPNNKRFLEFIGEDLPSDLHWIKWYDAHSIGVNQSFKLGQDNLASDVLESVMSIEKRYGDIVREIIENNFMNRNYINHHTQITVKHPKNQILYGPPGTGKTYNTINKALEIINDEEVNQLDWDNRSAVKALFDRKLESGQIAFTTFHQSLSYEDFIEGIKPQAPSADSGSLSYEVEPGIFKLICETAANTTVVKKQNKETFDQASFFKMSIGGKNRPDIHDWCLENNVIGLGYGNDKNFDGFKNLTDWGAYRDKFASTYPELVAESRYHIQAMFIFQRMKIGDVVVITKGNHVIDAIGKITSEYYWDDSTPTEYTQFRKVEWLAKNINQTPAIFFNKNISQQTIYEFYEADVKRQAFESFFSTAPTKDKNYVLIIDEINRGNVSAIFGELITLIEESKRKGNEEALEVTLPYSKEKFSIPNNVFIIGTMNTADRSVEALDTALRRRFAFTEMLPKPSLLADQIFEEVSLQIVLEKINERIEILLDADHQIGHSYLINVDNLSELADAFNNCILPLLQEYFYHDEEKIYLVLGKGFIKPKVIPYDVAAIFPAIDNLNIRLPYLKQGFEILTVDETTIINALYSLLGNA